MCNEPMQGVAVFLEEVTCAVSDEEASQSMGRLTGEIIRTVRDSIREGFLDWSPRIMLAMYSCEIQASAEVLGRVYSVITRRRGHIVSEFLLEPSPNFTILALLPVAERDEVIADLAAEFAYRATEFGESRAHAWYWRQTVSSAPALVRRSWWRGWNGFGAIDAIGRARVAPPSGGRSAAYSPSSAPKPRPSLSFFMWYEGSCWSCRRAR